MHARAHLNSLSPHAPHVRLLGMLRDAERRMQTVGEALAQVTPGHGPRASNCSEANFGVSSVWR